MSYNTNNPVPSSDLRDFYDNNLTIDKIVNSSEKKTITRTGKEIPTWIGFQDDVNKISQQAAQSASNSAASALQAKAEADRAAAANPDNWEVAPHPDVWIPFSDSVQMLAGYGKHDTITIGADTVDLPSQSATFTRASTATYVDKSGVLQTAAINEPRFEKEGLLIEGQSTNLYNHTKGSVVSWLSSGLTQTETAYPAPGCGGMCRLITSSDFTPDAVLEVLADYYASPVPATAGATVTISAFLFGDAGKILEAGPRISVGSSSPVTSQVSLPVVSGNGWVRVSTSITLDGLKTSLGNVQVHWKNRLSNVILTSYQLETLPFASSYIPTNGAAATRATEICTIQTTGNLIPDNCTFATEYDLLPPVNVTPGLDRRIIEFGSGAGASDRGMLHLSDATKKITAFWGGTSASLEVSPPLAGRSVVAVRRTPTNLKTIPGVTLGQTQAASLRLVKNTVTIGGASNSNDSRLFGHVRNFRIWHRALTDAQLKSLR